MSVWERISRFTRRPGARDTGAFLLLAGLIFSLHSGSLRFGLFMDDYAHFRQLQECDWSLSGLAQACRLEIVGGVVELWFMPECTLRFFRPLAFGLMKLTYTLSGWSPAAMHFASLIWHLLVCTLLMGLLRKLGARPLLAWAVAGLFAVHPGQVAAVQWIACQTELMVTAFLLAATLCYLRFRGWSEAADGPDPRRARCGWAAACVLLFGAALGCRENAVMLPVVLLGVECVLWRRRTRQGLGLYALLAVVAGAYLVVRWAYLAGAGSPPRPYLVPLGDPEFLRYVFDKACYYLLGEFLLVPVVPFGGQDYLSARPLMLYGLTGAVMALLLAVSWHTWRRGPARLDSAGLLRKLDQKSVYPEPRWPGLLGPAWLLGFMLPVLPVFAAPHHLYLPAVGWAVTAMLALRWIGGTAERSHRLRRATMWACTLLLGVGFGVTTLSFGEVMSTASRVEDLVANEVAGAPSGLRDGDTLYVANLPIIAHYVGPAVEYQTGLRNLHVRVLTWAPRVLGLVGADVRSEVTWRDDRTIEVRVVGDHYFSGPLGRLVGEASPRPVPTQTPHSLRHCGFRAEVLERDPQGVKAIRFTFDTPPGQPGVHLFWGSRTLWAFELQPDLEP